MGVVLHSRTKEHNLDVLTQLGVRWYLDLESDMTQVPDGASKVPYLKVPTSAAAWAAEKPWPAFIDELSDPEIAQLGLWTKSQLQAMAQANPGSAWYIFGEPNRYGYMTGDKWAPLFRYFATVLKSADPTATILSPSVLNWDFTCIGCIGYQLGMDWANAFVDAYEAKYGLKPPVDVWAIDTYPIDWINTPNNDPSQRPLYVPGAGPINFAGGGSEKHSSIATQQLVVMRQYLDSIGHDSKPIWIMELAVHVGYDTVWVLKTTGAACNDTQVQSNECEIGPGGVYHPEKMSNYMIEVLDWLDVNAEGLGVEKWFLYKTYRDLINISNDGYMGISLLDDPAIGTAPNCLGETYRTRSLQLAQKLKCDAVGDTVFAD